MSNAPFYIGQKVVCVDESNSKFLKKEKIETVLDIKFFCCGWEIYCGYNELGKHQSCSCGAIEGQNDSRVWYKTKRFAPIEENTYEDCTRELAKLPVEEVPDVKKIKELLN